MRILTFLIFVSLTLSTNATIRQHYIDSIVIKYASWNIITDIGIDCNSFERSLNHQIVTKTDDNTILQILSELDRLKISQKGGEDIRCKLEFYHSDSIVQSCCIGSIITKIDSNYYYTTHSLMAIIDSVVDNSPIRDKERIDSWDPILSIQKISDYLNSQSDRMYKDITLYEDLAFTVFCYVGEGGKTLSTRFTKNQNGMAKEIPVQVVSVINEILTNEITWDIPQSNPPQWVPINISIKSNPSATR